MASPPTTRGQNVKDFIQKTEIAGGGGKKSFSGDRIENYLDSHGDALRVWFGNDFVKQLGDIGQRIKPYDNVGLAKLSEEDAFIFRVPAVFAALIAAAIFVAN